MDLLVLGQSKIQRCPVLENPKRERLLLSFIFLYACMHVCVDCSLLEVGGTTRRRGALLP